MDIVSESHGYFLFYFVLSLIVLLMAGSLYLITKNIVEFMKYRKVATLLYAIFFGTLLVVNINNSVRLYQLGVPVTYKAAVTDLNEVHKQGYKIVGQEGKLYKLKKERDK